MRKTSSALGSTCYLFDGPDEAAAAVKESGWLGCSAARQSGEWKDEWVGRPGLAGGPFDRVRAALRDHWQQGHDTLARFADELARAEVPEIKSRRRRVRFDEDQGDEIDLDRLRGGQPWWRLSRREEAAGPTTVTVMVDISASASVSADDVLWRGAAAVALTCLLEEKGYGVELWLVWGGTVYARGRGRLVLGVQLKRPEDPLDWSTLVNAVSSWYMRTCHFALVRSLVEGEGRRVAEGLGYPYTPRPQDLDEMSRDTNRIYVAGVFSYEAAVSVVRDELARVAAR